MTLRAARVVVAAAVLALGAPVHATPPPHRTRVLLLPPGPGDPVSLRLLDELVAAGIAVQVVPTPAGEPAALAGLWDADAVLRVEPEARAIVVWVVPVEAGEAPEQRFEVAPGRTDGGAELALRSVEALRGRLLRVEVARREREPSALVVPPAPTASSSAPSPQDLARLPSPERRPPAPPRRAALYIAPALSLSPGGGIGPGGAALAGVRFISGHFGADAFALISVAPGVVDAVGGRVKLSSTAIGIGAWADAFAPTAPIALGAGLGLAGAFLAYDAQANDPAFVGRSGIVGYSLPYVRAALEWRAFGHVALRLDGLVGVAAPRPVVAVGPDAVASFGRPLVALALGVEMTVP